MAGGAGKRGKGKQKVHFEDEDDDDEPPPPLIPRRRGLQREAKNDVSYQAPTFDIRKQYAKLLSKPETQKTKKRKSNEKERTKKHKKQSAKKEERPQQPEKGFSGTALHPRKRKISEEEVRVDAAPMTPAVRSSANTTVVSK